MRSRRAPSAGSSHDGTSSLETATASHHTLEVPKLRRKIKLFKVGDVVEVYSHSDEKWFRDAAVTEVATKSVQPDFLPEGRLIGPGSMKVVYDNGRRFKWIAPSEMEDLLRPSTRKRPPRVLSGELCYEQHNVEWTVVYVELREGFLAWWPSIKEAKARAKPAGREWLLGFSEVSEGTIFRVRTSSTHGKLHAFQAENEEEAQAWVSVLWSHAGYCAEILRKQRTLASEVRQRSTVSEPDEAHRHRGSRCSTPCEALTTDGESPQSARHTSFF